MMLDLTLIVMASAVILIVSLSLFGMWFLMGEEGRFMLKANIGEAGVDVIRVSPISNAVTLLKIKWDGLNWWNKKEGIFTTLDPLLNPTGEADHLYNKAITNPNHWNGSHRPVVFAADTVSVIVNGDLQKILSAAEKHADYEKVKGTVELLAKVLGPEVKIVSFLDTLKPQEITRYLEDVGPSQMVDQYDMGKKAKELENTRPQQGISFKQIVIGAGALIGLGILIYLISQSGVLSFLTPG